MADIETLPRPAQTERPAAPADGEPSVPLTGIALVLAIAGLLLFMAVPGRPLDAASAAAERAEFELTCSLNELRGAIHEYRQDHGFWPGLPPAHRHAEAVEAHAAGETGFARELELFTDPEGRTMPRRLASHPFGPYLTHGVPVNPLNGSAKVRILGPTESFPAVPAGSWGWIYSPFTGELRANVPGSLAGSDRRIFDL